VQGWDNDQNVLDNNYYHQLLNFPQWTLILEDNPAPSPFPNQFYWEVEVDGNLDSGVFMLHADMALAFDMVHHLEPSNGAVNCTLVPTTGQDVCPTSPLRAQAELYRNDNDLWVQAFESAFLKMINIGCGNGVCIDLGVTAPQPVPTKAPTSPPTNAPVRPPTMAPTMAQVGLTVSEFLLVNADTDKVIMTLNNGATLSRKAFGTKNFNIVALTSHPNPKIGSVRFALNANSNFRTEQNAPFALVSDDGKGNYYGWVFALGKHTVTATPYSLGSAKGQQGTPQTVTFTVVA
jgi:hypothetical protein